MATWDNFLAFMGMDFVVGFVTFYAVKAYVELGIADILARLGGQGTVREIAAQLPSQTTSVEYLGRLMIFGAAKGWFEDSTPQLDEDTVVEYGDRHFRLTDASRALLEKESANEYLSMARLVRFLTHEYAVAPFVKYSEAVLTGRPAFTLAHGQTSEWELAAAKPEWARAVDEGMAAHSANVTSELATKYLKLDGIKRLVDVGGGNGASLAAITRAHPKIKGVNFDLPHVVDRAPAIPGVERVAGDMFQSVPEGDAIFMKWILHDWPDEKCVQILQNCHKSLPESGKVIIAEVVLPDPKKARAEIYFTDMVMLGHTGGRERTAPQWRRLLNAANFPRMEIIPGPLAQISIIEGYKSS